jgi:hypothetical protein
MIKVITITVRLARLSPSERLSLHLQRNLAELHPKAIWHLLRFPARRAAKIDPTIALRNS